MKNKNIKLRINYFFLFALILFSINKRGKNVKKIKGVKSLKLVGQLKKKKTPEIIDK